MQQQKKYYFEKQQYRRCGLHAVNNLLQRPAYTNDQFQKISEELSKQSQQSHSTLILGNYDFNVLEKALLGHGKELKWHRGEQVTIEDLKQENLFGILLHITKEQTCTERLFNWEPKHWIAISKVDNNLFVYLDSKLESWIEYTITYFIYKINDIMKDTEISHPYLIWVLNMKSNT